MSSKVLLLFGATEDISALYVEAVKDILAGELSVLELVEGLSSYLTSPDEEKRRQGVLLLANVLKHLPVNYLNKNEATVLAEFFCDRLKDRLTIIPVALMGLESVSLMENISDDIPKNIMLAMSMNITAQTLTQTARISYYTILKNLMYNKAEVLLKNSSNFVYDVISAMDAESDPRCLIHLFQFLPRLLSQFPLNHLTEETFSVLECYFPVDFNPKEKTGITREDLAQGLQNCLLATPLFAPYIIPTTLEKLDSQLKVAHLDSLKLLIEGIKIWPINNLKPHSSDIWRALSKLILPPADNEVAELAVRALVCLIKAFAESTVAYQELDLLLDDISAGTYSFLSDPSLSLFLPATKLLAAVSQVSERSCEYIIRTVIGQLLVLLEQDSGQDVTLAALSPILNASVKFKCWNNDSNRISKLLEVVPDKIIDILLKTQALRGCFACLIQIASYLSAEQRQKINAVILEALSSELSPSDSEMCSEYIKLIGTKFPEELKTNLLLKLVITDNSEQAKRYLEVFGWCCNVLHLTAYSVEKILQHITSETPCSTIAVNCLRELCSRTDEKVLTIFGTECGLPEKLVTFALERRNKLVEENIISISKILQAIVRSLNSSQQKVLLNNCLIQFLPPQSTSFPSLSNIHLFLLEGLVCPLRQDVSINMCGSLVTSLIDSSINNEFYSARESACIILASIINKYQNDSSDDIPLNGILKTMENGRQKEKEMILLLSWMTKSLIMRGHGRANMFLDKLIMSLGNNMVQMEAAEGFRLLLLDHESLSLRNYCAIKLLHKQRIFLKLNDLIALLDNLDKDKKVATLLAVAYIMQYVPKSLVVSRLKEIIPVMIQCIDSNSSVVMAVILEVIAGLLEAGENSFEEYIDTFVPRCLKCVQTSGSMVVRIQALNCIYYYGTFKEISILPHRDKVLNGLVKSLDDKKRLVRQKAVRARNRWFLVGGLPDR